jgi:Putative adhesin
MSGFGWKAVGGLLAIGTVGWSAFNVVSLVAHEERTEVRTYDAADVRVIDVQSSAGSVTIEGAPGRDEITVTARVSDGLRETGERQALVDGRLELRASCPVIGSEWCNVKYTIEAPADVEVRADSDNGRLTVRRVDGAVDLQADNGSVDVADLSGPLTIAADNGSITGSRLAADTVMAETDNGSIALEFVEPPTTVDARSDNGRVEVVLPDTEDFYNLDITTDNGEVSRDIRNDPTSSRRITIQTDNGDVTARYGP